MNDTKRPVRWCKQQNRCDTVNPNVLINVTHFHGKLLSESNPEHLITCLLMTMKMILSEAWRNFMGKVSDILCTSRLEITYLITALVVGTRRVQLLSGFEHDVWMKCLYALRAHWTLKKGASPAVLLCHNSNQWASGTGSRFIYCVRHSSIRAIRPSFRLIPDVACKCSTFV